MVVPSTALSRKELHATQSAVPWPFHGGAWSLAESPDPSTLTIWLGIFSKLCST